MKNEDVPAFPIVIDDASKNQFSFVGLSKREYFAAKALQGLCVKAIPDISNIDLPHFNYDKARYAVHLADALIKALKEVKDEE